MLGLEKSFKELLFVFFLVLVPTVPVAVGLVFLLRRRKEGPAALTRGRGAATPFRLISIVGSVVTLAVLTALLIVIGTRWVVTGDNEDAVEPVVDGGRSAERLPEIPQQGNAAAGEVVFRQSGCADCHTLLAAKATGKTGPNLDESNPDFSRVVEYVTKGPGEMPSFLGRLSGTEIRNVAKYVAIVTPEDDQEQTTPWGWLSTHNLLVGRSRGDGTAERTYMLLELHRCGALVRALSPPTRAVRTMGEQARYRRYGFRCLEWTIAVNRANAVS